MTHIRAGWSRTQPDSECIGRMAFTSPPPLRKAPPWDGRLDLKKMHWKTYAYASPIHMRAHPIHVRTTWSLQQTTGTRTPQNWKAFVPSGYARMHHPDGFRRGRSFLPLVVSGFADRSIIVTLILNCLWRWFDSKLYVSDHKGVGQKERKAWRGCVMNYDCFTAHGTAARWAWPWSTGFLSWLGFALVVARLHVINFSF